VVAWTAYEGLAKCHEQKGGTLDPRLGVLLGPLSEQMLGAVSADVLVMGIGVS